MDLADLLGVRWPLLQAPMAGVQGSRLALAVCKAGGLGALPAAALTPDALDAEVRRLRAGTDRPWNLNFFCHAPPAPDASREQAWRQRLRSDYERFGLDVESVAATPGRRPFDADALALVQAHRPAVVSFHFGLPADDLLAGVRDAGCRVLSSATTVEEARWLKVRGVDAVIAQGWEAGGHRGHFLSDDLDLQKDLPALLPQIVAAVDVPVIAAGGIADARAVADAMALGAAGVQIGTAYLLCPEADTREVHRQALREPRSTSVTNVFTGRPARGIVNRAMGFWGPLATDVPAFPLATAYSAPLREAAEAQGLDDYSLLWAGRHFATCRDAPAAEITAALVQGFGPRQDAAPDR
ncbi:MAG TPA: nitronate monooxygenase [Pseudoxanthomonas sp.]